MTSTTSSKFTVGQQVKYTEYAIRPKRDAWLNAGTYEAKSRALKWMEDAKAVRGEVIEILANGIKVKTSDGCINSSLDYLWQPA